MAKRRRRRLRAEIARDRRRIADRYLRGDLQVEIAAELGLDQSTISRELKAIHGEWLKSTLVNFDEAKAREVAKIDGLEREYWQAWVRSQEDAETITKKTEGLATKAEDEETGKFVETRPAEVTQMRKGQVGDPRFLAGVQWCIEKRMSIFGLEAVKRLAIVDWREEAREKGLDASEVFESYVQSAYRALVGSPGEAEG